MTLGVLYILKIVTVSSYFSIFYCDRENISSCVKDSIDVITCVVCYLCIQQDRRTSVKSETSGSRPSTPSSQQSSADATSKGLISVPYLNLSYH